MKCTSHCCFVIVCFLAAALAGCHEQALLPELPADPPLSDFAFVSIRNNHRVVQVVSNDGRLQRVITDVNADSNSPAWSPSGAELAYVSSSQGGTEQIFLIDADGSRPRQLTQLSQGGHSPVWSPDGQTVTFLSGVNAAQDLYLVDKSGAGLTRLVAGLPIHFAPVFSKDDRRLLFVAFEALHWAIYQADTRSGQVTKLTQKKLDGFINPAWSHDRQKIAFVTVRGNGASLHVMNVDGSDERVLSNAPFSDATPAWSRTDRLITFSSGSDIYIIDADGSGEKNLMQNAAGNFSPVWSPDGKRIAFVSLRDGNSEIYLMNTNGSTVRRITMNTSEDVRPAWSPVIVE